MQTENLSLKKGLVLQSFAPLFLLLTIKYLNVSVYESMICEFIDIYSMTGIKAIGNLLQHPAFGSFIISFISVCWLIVTILIALGFNGVQKASFQSNGETIKIEDVSNDNGAAFLVTYVLPLLTDDVESIRNLIVFLAMLVMIILLLSRSNTFYQNPVLTAMKYRTFSFKFVNPSNDIVNPDRVYIGITYGTMVDQEKIIKTINIYLTWSFCYL